MINIMHPQIMRSMGAVVQTGLNYSHNVAIESWVLLIYLMNVLFLFSIFKSGASMSF